MGGILTADDGDLILQRQQLTGDAKWKDIGDLIDRWARRNPSKARDLRLLIEDTKAGMFDKEHGVLKDEAMGKGRASIIIDQELEQYIKAFYPNFLDSKDELHEFMRRFPVFNLRSKV